MIKDAAARLFDTPAQLVCRLCGLTLNDAEVVGDFVYGGTADQKFLRCPNCDVAVLEPSMSEEEEKRFYAMEFEKFMQKRSGDDFDWSGPEAHFKSNAKQFERRFPFLANFIKPGKRVLELGCSSGFMLLPLKERGLEVVGVDPSGGFTEFLKSRGIAVFDSMEGLKAGWQENRKFDVVMHFFVLEHIRTPIAFLQEALKWVLPGGVMVFEVPNRSDPLISVYKIPAFDKFYWSAAHHYYFNRNSLEYILQRVSKSYEIIPEQRYDLSNHMTWALEGKPGGQGKYASFFTPEFRKAYLESMKTTGYCDTLVARVYR